MIKSFPQAICGNDGDFGEEKASRKLSVYVNGIILLCAKSGIEMRKT